MIKKQRQPRRDDAVDRVRTIYWFQSLGEHLRTHNPRAVQRAIAPVPETDALGGPIKNNKFLGYSRGKHVPNATLVQLSAKVLPRSALVLNHVIWEILKTDGSLNDQARLWVGQLDPDVQKALVNAANEVGASDRTLKMLVRRASLDSLAALTILFRQSCEVERSRTEESQAIRTWMCACAIFRVLMIIGPNFITPALGTLIFELFVQRVFSKGISLWRARMDLEDFDFFAATLQLRREALSQGIVIAPPLSLNELSDVSELILIPIVSVDLD